MALGARKKAPRRPKQRGLSGEGQASGGDPRASLGGCESARAHAPRFAGCGNGVHGFTASAEDLLA